MKIVGIAFGVAVIGIIIAFIYEIKLKRKPYEK